jgi:hypothetical protein
LATDWRKVGAFGVEVAGRLAVGRYDAELPVACPDGGGQGAHHVEVALERRWAEALLGREVVDQDRPLCVKRVPRKIVTTRRKHSPQHSLGKSISAPNQHAAAVAGQLQNRDVVAVELAGCLLSRRFDELVEGRAGQSALAELGDRRLLARANRHLVSVSVGPAPDHGEA